MFTRLREIFVGQYIGAMLIALVAWQALVELVNRIVRIGYWFFGAHQSVLPTPRDAFPWENLTFSVVSITLYTLLAYGLARWLYLGKASVNVEPAQPSSELP